MTKFRILKRIFNTYHWLICKFWNDDNSQYVLDIENSTVDIVLTRNLHLSRPLTFVSKRVDGGGHIIYSISKYGIIRMVDRHTFPSNFILHGLGDAVYGIVIMP